MNNSSRLIDGISLADEHMFIALSLIARGSYLSADIYVFVCPK